MVGTDVEQGEQPATLHIVSHIRWDREGLETFETRRARLLDSVARLLDRMSTDPKQHFLLSGQTIILEDIAAVRPDLQALLVIYNAGGRLGIGPWYIQVDEALVSGEALLRNLLMARADATRHGFKLMPVGYVPDIYGHVSQLPQIFRGFGMDAAFLCHGAPVANMPFRWEGADGSAILVINHDGRTNAAPNAAAGLRAALEAQRTVTPDGPFLWLDDIADPAGSIPDDADPLRLIQSNLPGYVSALRDETSDSDRPVLKGELRLQGLREYGYLLPGTLSARIYLKQANARLQNLLTHAAEPWLALALTHGQVTYPENLRALLDYSWRLLLKNQSCGTLGGCSVDSVHEENEIRYTQCEDSSSQVIYNALRALSGSPQWTSPLPSVPQDTYVAVWNPHNWPIQQVVEVPLRLPVGLHPGTVINPEGAEVVFGWRESHEAPRDMRAERTGFLSLNATVPPVGYAVYRVTLSVKSDVVDPARTPGTAITAVPDMVTLSVQNGRLVTKVSEPPVYDTDGSILRPGREQAIITDLLRFFDGGDAGDVYNYSPPHPDVIVQGDLVPDVQIESAALYQRLIMRHRLRVAPALRPDRSRGRGVKLLELTTTATLYDYMPGVYFQTSFENIALDHRLRVHLRTGIASDTLLADSAFGVVARSVAAENPATLPRDKPNMETVSSTHPMHSLCAVQDDTSGMALLARGLPEIEAIPEDGQTTLALTLLRAVGWIGRGDLRTRTGPIGSPMAVPGAQCQRSISAEYALVPVWPNDPNLLRVGREYTAPLQAYQYQVPPEKRQHSYLTIEGEGVVMTALKPPQAGRGWIVRLFNPTAETLAVRLQAHSPISRAAVINLAEESQQELQPDSGTVQASLDPQQIMTLRLEF